MALVGYKFTSKINMSHSTKSTSVNSSEHFHTFEIFLYAQKSSKRFSLYEKIEEKIKDFLFEFAGKNLNQTEYFSVVEPTLENIADYFYDHFKIILNEESFDLITLEMCEVPTKIFSVSEKFALGLSYSKKRAEKLEILLAKIDCLEGNKNLSKGALNDKA